MRVTPDQIRAARALKNWSQTDLAQRVDMATPSIGNIEAGKHAPTPQTQSAIIDAFESAGIEFIDGGVRHRSDLLTIMEGNNWYVRLLDDVYYSLKNLESPEVLLICGDDSKSPPEVIDRWRRIRSSSIAMRQLVEDGNTYLMGPLKEYRYIPREHFNNYVSLIYGEKIAICADGNTKAVIFKDPFLAKTWTNIFNVMWDTLEQPEKSNADARF